MMYKEPSEKKIQSINKKMFGSNSPLVLVQEDDEGNKVSFIPKISYPDAMYKIKDYNPTIIDMFEKLITGSFCETMFTDDNAENDE